MPSISSRMVQNMEQKYDPAPQSQIVSPPYVSPEMSYSNNLMARTHGNMVPMRGILPVEQMNDTDLHRFFPYTAYSDRIPKFTYYSLLTQSKTK